MINLLNNQKMTREMRLASLKRALLTQPFFTSVPFPLAAGSAKQTQYGQQIDVNRDFYLTQIFGNFGEVFTNINALFNLSLYTGHQKSLYRFDAQQPLPSGFITQEARFRTPIVNQIFDDRQNEFIPILIKNGDKIFVQIENTNTKIEADEVLVVLGGFQLNQAHIDARIAGQLQNSLDQNTNTSLDFFKFEVEVAGQQTFTIRNDSFPRMVLGFGVTNNDADKADVSASNVLITDNTRYLQFSNRAIPLQFLAPRMTCLLDTHIYYLPIEYYLQPFGKLQFDLSNVGENPAYDLAILTRTI